MQQENLGSKRKCTIKCDRTALTSLISSELRHNGIPMVLLGGDIIRGALFDMIDHPEHSIATSVGRAVDFSKFPGTLGNVTEDEEVRKKKDITKGYNLIYDALEASTMDDIPWISGMEKNAHEKKIQVVDKALRTMASSLRISYCHTIVWRYFNRHPLKLDSLLAEEIMKDMVFKKLVADDSTKECMYEYAYRKELQTRNYESYEKRKLKIFHTMRNYCSAHRKTPYQLACELVDKIYEEEADKE